MDNVISIVKSMLRIKFYFKAILMYTLLLPFEILKP